MPPTLVVHAPELSRRPETVHFTNCGVLDTCPNVRFVGAQLPGAYATRSAHRACASAHGSRALWHRGVSSVDTSVSHPTPYLYEVPAVQPDGSIPGNRDCRRPTYDLIRPVDNLSANRGVLHKVLRARQCRTHVRHRVLSGCRAGLLSHVSELSTAFSPPVDNPTQSLESSTGTPPWPSLSPSPLTADATFATLQRTFDSICDTGKSSCGRCRKPQQRGTGERS